jgi:UDP-3-O-[3-hydroxymyristoyl] glucosamine N-acyltransferase
MTLTVATLAARIGGVAEGVGDAEICGVSGLAEARDGDVSFLANPRYGHLMAETAATAVVVAKDWTGAYRSPALIRVDNPDKAFITVAMMLGPPPVVRTPGVHPTAVVSTTAKLGRDVYIGACTVIEDGAVIGDRTVIEAQCFVGCNTVIGADSFLFPQVAIREGCRIGDRFIAHCGAVIGSDGFGYNVEIKNGRPAIVKIPQIGIVVIGNDVELGSNLAIDRARFGVTRLGNQVKIDNLVQIAHNVQVGDCTGICGQVGIAGSTQIGAGVMIWAQAGIAGHLKINDRAQIGAQSGVGHDVPAGEFLVGTPAVSKREYVALQTVPRKIEKLKTRIEELEARLAALEATKAASAPN